MDFFAAKAEKFIQTLSLFLEIYLVHHLSFLFEFLSKAF
jgi:hypothetical protein